MPLPLELRGRPDERVLRQLVSTLLFERVVEAHQCVNDGIAHWSWTLGSREFRCTATLGPFDRVRVKAGSVQMKRQDGTWEEPVLANIVPFLPGTGVSRGKLLGELSQTIEFCTWNDRNIPERPRRSMSFADLEGALDEGHPYHPCYKARMGFSAADHAAYGPETGKQFQLVWLLVARKYLRRALPCEENAFWAYELGEETWGRLNAALQHRQVSLDGFGLVPLHPWQWRNVGKALADEWIEAGEAHYLGAFGDFYTATQSVRSLLNRSRPFAASVKLPMNIVNTSSRRTLEPHSVYTAPVVSDWIGGIVDRDSLFRERYPLKILKEYAGVIAGANGRLSGQVAAIWRESAEATISDGESIVPFNSLMMVERDGRPFADHWIKRHGLMPWTNRLIEVAVLPVWHLFVFHGIATEAHGQNMLLVHRDGWPVRLILRDFHESIEFSPGFLREPAAAPDFASLSPLYHDAEPDQFYWTDNLDSLRELVMDTLFIYNLSEISYLLELFYSLPEPVFWQRVERLLLLYAKERGMAGRQEQVGWNRPIILTELLMTRKLLAAKSEYHHPVPNTLAAKSSNDGESHDPD